MTRRAVTKASARRDSVGHAGDPRSRSSRKRRVPSRRAVIRDPGRFEPGASRVFSWRASGPHSARLAVFACSSPRPPAGRSIPRRRSSQYGHDVWTSDSGLPQNSVTAIAPDPRRLPLARDAGRPRPIRRRRASRSSTRATRRLSRRLGAGPARDPRRHALDRHGDRPRRACTERRVPDAPGGPARPRDGRRALRRAATASLWVGSSLGVTRIAGGAGSARSADCDGLPGPVSARSPKTRRGTLWVGGTWGAARLEGERFEPWTVRDGFPGAALSMLADPDGGLWVGTGRGLARVDGLATTLLRRSRGGTDEQFRPGAPRATATAISGSRTDGGLFRFRDGRFVRHGDGRRPLERPDPLARRRTARAASGSGRPTAGSTGSRNGASPIYTEARRALGRQALVGLRGQPRQPLGGHRRGRPEPPAGRQRPLRAGGLRSARRSWRSPKTREGALWIGTRGGGARRASRAAGRAATRRRTACRATAISSRPRRPAGRRLGRHDGGRA